MIFDRIFLSKRINDLIKGHNIDLVESYDWSGPLWSKPIAPLIVRLHGANSAYRYFENFRQSHLISYFEKQNIKMADKLIAVSDHIGKTTLDALKINHKKYDVIYNGVDTQLFRDLNFVRNNDEILFVGTVSRRKGIYELFKAYNLVLQQKPNTKLKIVGSLPEGEKKEELISNLLSYIPSDKYPNVRFLGRIPFESLPGYYNHASLAVFPSLAEAFGLTCAEAMACGTPVIMTSKASGPELVEDDKSGLLINVINAEEIAGKILFLLNNPFHRQKIGKAAQERVRDKFEINKISLMNQDYYSRIKNELSKSA